MKKFNTRDAAALLIWLLPAAYLFYIYPTLPQRVAVHFGVSGMPDRYGSKTEMLIGPVVLMSVSVLVYLLLKFLPAIDPKKMVKYGEPTFQKIAMGVVIFLAALDICIIVATVHPTFKIPQIILPVAGLFFAFIGNMMNSIKPNYFAGVRTPWTLEDADTWRATHRLTGKVWFVGGILTAILTLLLPTKAAIITFFSIKVFLVLIPVAYSYIYYKKRHPTNTGA